MTDKPVILCFRESLGIAPQVKGAVLRPCERCGNSVWVAPSTFEIIEQNNGGTLICDQCFPDVVPGDVQFAPPSEEQLAEMPPPIRQAFRDMLDRMKRHQH